MGQDTLKVLLDEFFEERKIKSLSASTIKIPNPKAMQKRVK